ncbi:MAG: hypothetical protein WD424_02250 [Paenibacillaceae bacterium]
MRKYKFDLIQCTITGYREKDHIILASSLTDAIQKFIRKHELEAPAYWDEPSYDRYIELTFTSAYGAVNYLISW